VWIKIDGEQIWDLQKKIDDSLFPIFEKEDRFMSHTTIARLKYVKDKENFNEKMKKMRVKEVKFQIGSFKLMKSELKMMGPVYTLIEEFNTK